MSSDPHPLPPSTVSTASVTPPKAKDDAPRPGPSRLSEYVQGLLQSRGRGSLIDPSSAPAGTCSFAQAEAIFGVMHAQRQRWEDGERPPVEQLVRERPEFANDTDGILHLIYNEVVIREGLGEQPQLTEYLQRFPNLADDLNLQFALHEVLPAEDMLETRPAADVPPPVQANMPQPGDHFDDFEILRVLGSGSFASVYLARQVSLDRLVALKVSSRAAAPEPAGHAPVSSGEARTLASLEHNHIVQVFSETVEPEHKRRLLCMQYVPGTTLANVIEYLSARPNWTGRDLLDGIDLAAPSTPVTLDPAALRDREYLSRCDAIEAVCWLGGRLAEALAYAHQLGVLHRDIKPANILMNPYGRPLLADFNLALGPKRQSGSTGEPFGGTLEYMSPEHLDAFNPATPTRPDVVDQRSDIYSLGVVLFELLAGRRPFPEQSSGSIVGVLFDMAADRREGAPAPGSFRAGVPSVLNGVIRRCLEPSPTRRYQHAADLAAGLQGAGELCDIEQEMPRLKWLGRHTIRSPFLMLFVWVFLPHVLGSVENILYNGLFIQLTPSQKQVFLLLLVVYNVPVYSICGMILYWLGASVYRTWVALERGLPVTPEEVTAARRRALTWPAWVVGVSCIGWLPGGLLFPTVLHLAADLVSPEVFLQFVVSFTLSGLIALVYSYFAAEFVVLRIFYPRLWLDEPEVRARAASELSSRNARLGLFQLLAGLIPLTGAVMMLIGPEVFLPEKFSVESYRSFRLLVTALIALGMAGFGITLLASRELDLTLAALVGRGRGRR